jgi:DNA-binding HxlR family transcriptional regulator
MGVNASGRNRGSRGLATGVPPPKADTGCEVTELFAMLGRPHMLRILHAFEESQGHPIRFTQLQRRLALSPKTLTQRLRMLVEAGFVARRSYHEIPPRVEYAPTEKTAELREIFAALEGWSRRHSLKAVPMISVVGRVPSGAIPVPSAAT